MKTQLKEVDTTVLDTSDWQVPEYKIQLDNGRKTKYCVVIPVINEGERIMNMLRRMHELKIQEVADIIIVDGGTKDGSLELPFLNEVGVNKLILKTGKGKLSAQLRCAYADALLEGYEGIVTIDGNNKDEPDPIPQFIKALDDGIDFAQASRFINGGYAENTPLSRYVAIRMIHAPVLSIASGFKWTDSTQGFRAYSRKMLLDPRIKPFRDIFVTYELLAYLSYRVPKVGFKCVELPTSRVYPKGEVPSKISAFRGNWDVFKILFEAATGKYNPRQ